MTEKIDLADPDFEPTDEQLEGLMKRAFAGVGAAHEAALARIRAEIATARAEVLRALAARGPRKSGST
jgi:hypothetical protein